MSERPYYGELHEGDVIVLNGRHVRVVSEPIERPKWCVEVEDLEPRRYVVPFSITSRAQLAEDPGKYLKRHSREVAR